MLLQGEELEPARIKAEKAGVKQIFIDDLREDFVGNYVFPMFRCNGLVIDRMVWSSTCSSVGQIDSQQWQLHAPYFTGASCFSFSGSRQPGTAMIAFLLPVAQQHTSPEQWSSMPLKKGGCSVSLILTCLFTLKIYYAACLQG